MLYLLVATMHPIQTVSSYLTKMNNFIIVCVICYFIILQCVTNCDDVNNADLSLERLSLKDSFNKLGSILRNIFAYPLKYIYNRRKNFTNGLYCFLMFTFMPTLPSTYDPLCIVPYYDNTTVTRSRGDFSIFTRDFMFYTFSLPQHSRSTLPWKSTADPAIVILYPWSSDVLKKDFYPTYRASDNLTEFSYIKNNNDLISVKSYNNNNDKIVLETRDTNDYILEHHEVVTQDGYILTLHRLVPKNKQNMKLQNKVALLHHGLLGSTDDWFFLGPKKAFPYLLAYNGFDVWLTNARGNKYSKKHMFRSIDSYEYWNFSFHEMGQFDLPAVVDYMRNATGDKSQIDYIGHSLGATVLLVFLSTNPGYNLVIKSATFLGPLSFMYNVSGPLRALAEFQGEHGYNSLSFLKDYQFSGTKRLPQPLLNKFCIGDPLLCLNPWLFIANGGQKIPNVTLKSKILSSKLGGGSTKTIKHFCQLVNSGQFQMYDYGDDNIQKYGKQSPPYYRLNYTTIPVVIFSSKGDWLSTIPDAIRLITNLPNPILHHINKRENFTHTDFLWSDNAPTLIYYPIIDIITKIS